MLKTNIDLLDCLTSLSEQINAIAYSLPNLRAEHKEIFFGELITKSDQLLNRLKSITANNYQEHLESHHVIQPNKYSASQAFTFATRLRSAMKAAGLTQKELAERAGVSQSVISRLITGKDKSGTRSGVLSHALGVNLDWLHYGTGEMFSSPQSSEV